MIFILNGKPAMFVKVVHINDSIIVVLAWTTFVKDRQRHL